MPSTVMGMIILSFKILSPIFFRICVKGGVFGVVSTHF